MGHEMERLVCCKELLHILDQNYMKVSTPSAVVDLIEKIILPPELVDPFADGIHTNSDRVAILHALAVLFPLSARAILLPPFKDGKLSAQKIAEIAELPVYYIQLVLNDGWLHIHKLLASIHA